MYRSIEYEELDHLYTIKEFRRKLKKEGKVKGAAYFCNTTKVSDIEFKVDQPTWRPIWATRVLWVPPEK